VCPPQVDREWTPSEASALNDAPGSKVMVDVIYEAWICAVHVATWTDIWTEEARLSKVGLSLGRLAGPSSRGGWHANLGAQS
jgi:hypothetical protein